MEAASAAAWRDRVANREGVYGRPGGAGAAPALADPSVRMRRMAERLRADGRRDMTHTPVYEAVAAGLGPDRTVLDIGAGTGRYTVPFAAAGCRVWALERDAAMRGHLGEELAGLPPEAAARVSVVEGAWPEAAGAVPRVEVALACLVIHFCPDAVGFLRAMEAVASRRCVLAIRVDQMAPVAEELWPLFHPDRPFPAQPVFADLYRLMLDMGIRADVRVHDPVRSYGRYRDLDEAVEHMASFLHLEGASDLERLRAALGPNLRPAGDGSLAGRRPVREAVVSWAPAAGAAAGGVGV